MPYFNAAPGSPTLLVSAGSKTYLLGSIASDGGNFYITNVALASNVATVTVTGFSGVLPVVGTLIDIRGSQQQAGAFNVTQAPVTALNLDATGAGTISFALTGANLATTADSGTLSFIPQVTGETVVAGSTISGALARPSGARSQNAVFCQLTASSGISALTCTMQVSSDNVNWTNTTAVLTLSAPTGYFETTALFVRGTLSGLTGTGTGALLVNI
jgi:hypothetical protein